MAFKSYSHSLQNKLSSSFWETVENHKKNSNKSPPPPPPQQKKEKLLYFITFHFCNM